MDRPSDASRPKQKALLSLALMGQPSFHLYSVPGVIASLSVPTFFECTNTTSANIRVGVETFWGVGGPANNDPSGTSLDIPAGGGAEVISWEALHPADHFVLSTVGRLGVRTQIRAALAARGFVETRDFLGCA